MAQWVKHEDLSKRASAKAGLGSISITLSVGPYLLPHLRQGLVVLSCCGCQASWFILWFGYPCLCRADTQGGP